MMESNILLRFFFRMHREIWARKVKREKKINWKEVTKANGISCEIDTQQQQQANPNDKKTFLPEMQR